MTQITINQMMSLMSTFSGYSLDNKRMHSWAEYGYPKKLEFSDYYKAFERSGYGKAGVVRHVEQSWLTNPDVYSEVGQHDQTLWEKEFKALAKRTKLWKIISGADRRNRVGRYAGLIFIYADGKRPDQPIGKVSDGSKGLVRIIPAYESQLKPTKWDGKRESPRYGMPVMYQYSESTIGDKGVENPGIQMSVHHSRVHILAEGADDGSIYGTPALQAGYNSLVTIEKIIGAGGEGFFKNARTPMKFSIPKDVDLNLLARSLGTDVAGIQGALNETITDFNSGVDKALVTQGFDANNLTITLPNPQEFINSALNDFAASLSMPLKILMGNQTGERASSEDVKGFNATITSRRNTFLIPEIEQIIQEKLIDTGVMPEADIEVYWEPLDSLTRKEQLENAKVMADTNRLLVGTGETAYTADEIRDESGMEPQEVEELLPEIESDED